MGMKLSIIALRNIGRNKRRSLLSGAAIAIATLVIVFMFSVVEGLKVDMARNVFTYVSGHIRIRNAEYERYEKLNPLHLGIPDYRRVISEIEDWEGTALALPRITFFSSIYLEERDYRGMGMGIDFERELEVARAQGIPGTLPGTHREDSPAGGENGERTLAAFAEAWKLSSCTGELPRAGSKELLLSVGLAEEMGVGIGEKVTLLTKTAFLGMQAWTFRVTGLVRFPISSMNKRIFLAPLDSTQRFLKMDQAGDSVTEILVFLRDTRDLEADAAGLNAALEERGNLTARSWKTIGTYHAMLTMVEQVYSVIAFVFFLLGTTVIVNTTMMVIYERMKEIGTIAAMGMTGREIVVLFFLEALFISLAAGFVGIVVGSALVLPLSSAGIDFGAAMEGVDIGMSTVIHPILNLRSTLFVFVYATGVASLASFLPTIRAARVEPVEALRTA